MIFIALTLLALTVEMPLVKPQVEVTSLVNMRMRTNTQGKLILDSEPLEIGKGFLAKESWEKKAEEELSLSDHGLEVDHSHRIDHSFRIDHSHVAPRRVAEEVDVAPRRVAEELSLSEDGVEVDVAPRRVAVTWAPCTYNNLAAAVRGVESRSWTNTANRASLHFDGVSQVLYFVKGALSIYSLGEYSDFEYAAAINTYRVTDKSTNAPLTFTVQGDNLRVGHRTNTYTFTRSDKQVIFVRHGTSVQNTYKDYPARRRGGLIRVTDANRDFADVTSANRTDAPLTNYFKIDGITRFGVTKWDILGHNGGAGLQNYITNNVRIHVSPHTRTLQTMILALYDIPHMQHATIVVDPRIREVRKFYAQDCTGSSAAHMRAQITAQFTELTQWTLANRHGINGIRGAVNNQFRDALIAAVTTAAEASKLETSGVNRWYGELELESGRGAVFKLGMWPEIQSYPESRVILFGHSSMFRAALTHIPGYSKTPTYYKTDKMINYGHLKINYASGYGFVPTNQHLAFKIAKRLHTMMAEDGGVNRALADVTRIAASDVSNIVDEDLKIYATGSVFSPALAQPNQIVDVFNKVQDL